MRIDASMYYGYLNDGSRSANPYSIVMLNNYK